MGEGAYLDDDEALFSLHVYQPFPLASTGFSLPRATEIFATDNIII